MPKYTVRFVRSARKELEALPESAVQRIFPRIEALADDPRPVRCRKRRIRIGNYRVVYHVDYPLLIVEIPAVGDRKVIYE